MTQRLIENITPILQVRSLQNSLAYYNGVLGFATEWLSGDPATTGSVERDGFSIMLTEAQQGASGTWIWIGVEDLDLLHKTFRAAGARFELPPTDFPWAYEMRIRDPDDHILRFGGGPRTQGESREL
jgi:predicted enzyme related to lactoylglutathione lyase